MLLFLLFIIYPNALPAIYKPTKILNINRITTKIANFVAPAPTFRILHMGTPTKNSAAHRIAASIFIAAIAASAILAPSCRQAPRWRITEGSVWRTTYRIVYDSPASLDDSIIMAFNQVESSLSPFIASSRISRINDNRTDSTDNLIDSVFSISQQVNAMSDGRFDPTVSPLVDLWGFGTDNRARANAESDSGNISFSVSPELIDSAMRLVGISQCHIDHGRMVKKHPATSFNFSAVTKGFACDVIAAMLKRNNVGNFMIEVGGEVVASGLNPQHAPWRIQIDAPDSDTPSAHNALRIINLDNCAVATSGNYRNYHDTREYGRIGHTIDPSTGRPFSSCILSASVIAPSGALADAWATACMASTPDSAIAAIARQPATECLLVIADSDSIRIITTARFPR